MRTCRPLVGGVLVVGTVAAVLLSALAAPTGAAAAVPAKPHGEHVVAATSSAFTVALSASANASSYRMYASTSRSAVYVANISTRTYYVSSSSPRITRTGLPYTSAPVYYRVRAMRGSSWKWGDIHAAGLRPANTVGVHVTAADQRVSLSWANQWAAGFVVGQATNSAMTANRVNRYVYGRHLQYTPYGLTPGTRYYFRVWARNSGTWSTSPSAPVSAVAPAHRQDVRVATYNVLEDRFDATHEGDGTVATWATRRPGVVGLIRQSTADVIGIEEASGWVGSPQGYGGRRQIDDLAAAMPEFALARTETPPTEHYYYRTGSYVLYRKSAFVPVGAGGHWDLGQTTWAAYQVLQSRATGARMLFVVCHLIASVGATYDAQRQQETSTLIRDATALAAQQHVPVVYTGDFNSDAAPAHAFDGPGRAMQAAHVVDARAVALWRYNDRFNSANQYLRTAPAFGYSIDYVYAGPGVGVRSWGVIVNLSGGRFVGTIASDHNPVWASVQLTY